MRVCIVRNSEGPMNAQLIRIGTALSKTENEFFFVTRTRDSESEELIVEKEMEIDGHNYKNYEIQLPAIIGGGLKNISPLLKFTKILTKWLKDNQDLYDVIHAVDYDTGSIAQKIAQKYNKKVVYHIADFYSDSRLNIPTFIKKYLRSREYNVINRTDATIICSDDRKEQIAGSHPKKLIVVHNTPPREQQPFTTQLVEEQEQIQITYVGGMEKKRFIDKAIRVIQDKIGYYLNLAGSVGDAREAIASVSTIDNINFLGKVPYEKALSLYNETSLMFAMYDPTHPNHKYSAANKVYEAMLMGKPIIVANNTGMDKIVRAEDIGYTIDFSEKAFSDILMHIQKNKEELYQKSLNAYNAYSKYSWEVMESRIINLYKEI